MTQKVLDPTMERRARPNDLRSFADRLIAYPELKSREHDEFFLRLGKRGLNPHKWNFLYRLREHLYKTSMYHRLVGEADGASEYELILMEVEGWYHDIGKTDKRCWLYRRYGVLTPGQRARVRLHTQIGGTDIVNLVEDNVEEDRKIRGSSIDFVGRLHDCPMNHDKPWAIIDPVTRRRIIGFQLVDMTQARMEFRYKPPLSLEDALASVAHQFRNGLVHRAYQNLLPVYEERFEVVKEVFRKHSVR
jgi:hypothetical protein